MSTEKEPNFYESELLGSHSLNWIKVSQYTTKNVANKGMFIVPARGASIGYFNPIFTPDPHTKKERTLLGAFIDNDLPPTPENCCAFAAQYAPLTTKDEEQSLVFWQEMHTMLRFRFDLRTLILQATGNKSTDTQTEIDSKLLMIAEWKGNQVPADMICYYNLFDELKTEPPTSSMYDRVRCITIAVTLLSRIILHYMKRYSTIVLPNSHDKTYKLKASLVPSSLLALLWYQIFQFANGEKLFKQCLICGQIADAKSNKWLTHRKDCINRERSKIVAKIDRALKFEAKGLPVKQIAKRMNTDVESLSKLLERGHNKKTYYKEDEE